MNRLLIVGEANSGAESLTASLEKDVPCVLRHDVPSVTELTQCALAAVVYCGEVSRSAWDMADDTALAHDEERLGNLLSLATAAAVPLVLVSSDAILQGPRIFSDETTSVEHGDQRSMVIRRCEQAVLNVGGLVLRTHLVDAATDRNNFACSTMQAIRQHFPPVVSGTWYATPIAPAHFAEVLVAAVAKKLTGQFHAGGAQRVNQWEFAASLAAAMNCPLKTPRLHASTEDNFAANITRETSLDSRRIQRELGKRLPMLLECVNEVAAIATRVPTSRLAA